jgi:hypothetical protein
MKAKNPATVNQHRFHASELGTPLSPRAEVQSVAAGFSFMMPNVPIEGWWRGDTKGWQASTEPKMSVSHFPRPPHLVLQ